MAYSYDNIIKPPVVNPAAESNYATKLAELTLGSTYNIPGIANIASKIPRGDFSIDDPNMYAKAAANTPLSETVGIGLKNLAVTSIGMFAQNASTLPDLFNGNIAKMAIGDADVWGETIKSGGLYGWGSNFMRDNMQTAMERNPNTVNPADPAWWANVIAPGVGSVIGIVGESALEARATALAGAAIGTTIAPGIGTAVGAAIGTGIGMVEKMSKLLQGLTTAKNAKKVFMGTYAIGRGREAIMNAAATYEETLQILRDKGIPEEQANKQASEAASYMFRRDFVTGTALGAVEAALMTYSPIKGGLVESASKWNVLERGLDLIPNKIAKTAAKTVVGMGLEGEEEGRQKVYDWEAKHYAMVGAGLEKENNFFTDRLPEYFTSAETWNNVLGGMAGGGFIPAIGYGVNKIGDKYTGMDKVYKAHKELLKDRDQGIKIEYIKKISEAFNDGDIAGANSLISNFNKHTSVYNLNFDRIVKAEGDASLYNSQLDFLEKTLKEATANPNETDDIKAIKNTYPELIRQTRNAKFVFDDEVVNKTPSHMLMPLTHAKLELGIIQDSAEKYRKDRFLTDKVNNDKDISVLGKEYNNAKSELFATQSLIETVKQSIDRETNTEIKSFLRKELKRFEERLKKNESEFKKVEDEYNVDNNDSIRREDNAIILAYGTMVAHNETIKKQQQAEEDAKIKREEIAKLNDKKEQERIKKVLEDNINKEAERRSKPIPETPEIRVQNKVVNVSDKLIKIEKEISNREKLLENPDQQNKDIITLELEQFKNAKIALEEEFKITKKEHVEIKEEISKKEESNEIASAIVNKVIEEKKEDTSKDINDVVNRQLDSLFNNANNNEDTRDLLFSPLTVGNNVNKSFYEDQIATIVTVIAEDKGIDKNKVTFKDVIDKFVNDLGAENKNRIEYIFNYLALGWNEYKGGNTKNETETIYKKVFVIERITTDIENELGSSYKSQKELSKDNDEIYAENITVPNKVIKTTESGTISIPTNAGNDNSLTSKVPLRGLGSTSVSVMKDGKITTTWTEGSHLNFDKPDAIGVNEKGFANPTKFNVKTPLVIELATDEQLEKIPIRFLTWQDVEDPKSDLRLTTSDPLLVGHNIKIIGTIPTYAEILKGATFIIDNGDNTQREIFYKIDKDSQEYRDTVPMIIRHKDHDLSYGSTYAYDVNYFNPVHNNENQQDIEGLRNIARTYRNIVLSKGSLNLKITDRNVNTFNPAILPNNEYRPLIDLGHNKGTRPKIGFFYQENNLYVSYNEVTDKLEKINIKDKPAEIKNTAFIYFMPVDKKGKEVVYQASMVQASRTKKQSNEIKDSIINALVTYVKAFNLPKGDPKIESIKTISEATLGTNYGLNDMSGARNYIKNFYNTYVKTGKGEEKIELFDIKIKHKVIPISYTDENGINQSTSITGDFFNQTPEQLAVSKDIIYKFFDTLPLNVNKESLKLTDLTGKTNLQKPVWLVTKEGAFIKSDEYKTYQDYAEQTLVHNIQSFNSPDEDGKDFYTPNIIPVLTVEISSSLSTRKKEDVIEEAIKVVPNNKDTQKETVTNSNDNDINTITNAFNAINGLYSIDYRQAKSLDQILNNKESTIYPSPISFALISERNRTIEHVSNVERRELVNSVTSLFHNIIINNELNIRPSKADLEVEIQTYIETQLESKSSIIERYKLALEGINKDKYPNVQLLIDDYKLLNDKILALSNDINSEDSKPSILINEVIDNLFSEEVIKEVDEDSDSDQLVFDRDSAEVDPFMKTGEMLKRFLFGQLDSDNKGNTITGFLGLPKYVNDDDIWSRLLELTCSENCSDITFEGKINALKTNATNLPWLWLEDGKVFNTEKEVSDYKIKQEGTVVGKLLKNNTDFKNLTPLQHNFTVAFTNNRRNSKMLIVNVKEGEYKLKVYDANRNGIANNIIQDWITNARIKLTIQSGTSDESIYNKETIRELVKEYNDLLTKDYTINEDGSVENTDLVIDWLDKVGIKISPELFKSFVEGKFYYENVKIPFYDILNLTKKTRVGKTVVKDISNLNNGSIFKQLNLLFNEILKDKEPTVFTDNGFNSYLLQDIAKKQVPFSNKRTSNSTREGGKTLFGYTAGNLLRDRTNNLKDIKLREVFLKDTFSKGSMILDLLNRSDRFNNGFSIFDISKDAIKFGKKKAYQDTDIVSLSDGDHELFGLGMFQDITQGRLQETYKDFKVRFAAMLPPAFSDKTSGYGIKTGVLDLTENDFNIDIDGGVSMSDNLRDILRDQLITPELNRIIQFNKQSYYNIAGYDGSIFFQIPQMNDVSIDVNGEKVKLIQYLRSNGTITPDIDTQIKTETNKVLDNVLNSLVNDKTKKWKELGITSDKGNKFDTKYVKNKFPTNHSMPSNTLNELVAYDYIINNMIVNSEVAKIYHLDHAFYVKGKIPEGKVLADLTSDELNHFIDETIDSTYDNITKRLAGLIAPGTQPSNSVEEDKYIQLNLADIITKAKQLDELIERLGEFGAQGYGNNNATDAQEYSTWREHVNLLVRYGKIPNSEVDFTEKDKEDVTELFTSERTLTEKDKLLLRKVLQPMKPVYVGEYFDENYGILRPIYIKSSAFPLLPQVTTGLEIDDLRRVMEAVEKKQGMFVRASYQSANKVGAVKNPLSWVKEDGTAGYVNEGDVSFFNDKGEVNPDIVNKIIANHSHKLSRNNFRIQQDIPFKSALHSEDKVSNMSQMAVLKLANGVTGLEGFKYLGNTMSGKEIQQENNRLTRELLDHKTKIFNDTFSNIEEVEKLIKKEAKDKNIQDIEALTLIEVTDEKGSRFEFNVPVWLTPDPDKYESLLQSIINKHIIKYKLPGYSFVAASSTGFKDKGARTFKTFEHTSRIVWADKPIEHLLGNQVVVSSKLRDNDDKLIDLTSDEYSTKESREDGSTYRKLNKEKIGDELLKLITTRIPTSNHSSMSLDDIVGFLPIEVGDIMLVAPDKTTQKGLDFDVDKENTYHFWTEVDKNGKIVPLHHKYEIKALNKQLEVAEGKTKDELNTLKEKVLNNLMIELDRSILSHDTVKTMTHVILSIDDAKEQSKAIKATNDKSSYWSRTFLSDEYQKQAMLKNASGKLGTAVYSNALIIQGLMEQIAITDPDNQLELTIGKTLFEVTIDGTTFDGKLGKIKNEKQSRNSLEVLGERQNFLVDNGTANIAGHVNLNKDTFDADVIMCVMNMDKGTEVSLGDNKINSIPFLLLNQPIIKDYVTEIQQLSGISDYTYDKDQVVLDTLLDRYKVDNEKQYEDGRRRPVSYEKITLTTSDFANGINSNGSDHDYQQACLDLFLKLKTFGTVLRKTQSVTKINAKGLGKSLLDTVDMLDRVEYVKTENYDIYKIKNASRLISNNNLPQHYIETGLEESKNKWLDLFPYKTDIVTDMFKEVSDKKDLTVKNKQDIMIEFKKFIFSRNTLLVTNNEENKVIDNRKDLFIDTKENDSLATYLYNATHELVTKNDLIRAFNYELKVDRTPSLIIFNNKQAEGISEKGMYDGLLSLFTTKSVLVNNKEVIVSDPVLLEPRNGKPYTTHNLLFDLIAYNYLKGGVQQATEYGKFIPILLLDWKFTPGIRGINTYLHKSKAEVDTINKKYKDKNIFGLSERRQSKFFIQYKQHHPETLPKKTFKDAGDLVVQIEDKRYPTMFSVKQGTKYLIYLKTDLKGTYYRIPVLGDVNVAEYNSSNEDFIYPSITNLGDNNNFDPNINTLFINDEIENIIPERTIEAVTPYDRGNHEEILNHIIKDVNIEENEKLIAESLKDYALDLLKDVKVVSEDHVYVGDTEYGGIYDSGNNTITLNKTEVDREASEGSRIYLHEITHALLQNDLKLYFDEYSNLKTGINIPEYINELSFLYGRAKEALMNAPQYKRKIPDSHFVNATKSIHEYVSEISTHRDIQNYLSEKKYDSKSSIYTKFIDIIKKFFIALSGKNELNITTASIANIMEALDVKREALGLKSMIKGVIKPEVGVNTKTQFNVKNIFIVNPIQSVDKKAISKAGIATQFIGFAEGIPNSSTALYAKQAGKYANTGNYSSDDVIFVSIGGKRGDANLRKIQQDRTINEVIKALDNNAIILTDNKSYIESNSYNEGEKRLYETLKNKNYVYSEVSVDGNIIGVWNKPNIKEEVKPTIAPISNDLNNLESIITYTPKGKDRQTYTIKGKQIFNKKGVEVFKTNSIDRNKILANQAVKEGKAVVVIYRYKKYIVYNNGDILSNTGNFMNWSNEDGNRKAILELAGIKNILPSPLTLSKAEQEELNEINKICNPKL